MFSPDAIRMELPEGGEAMDCMLASLPECAAVFQLELPEGQQPYLGRCENLRRRVTRLLRQPTGQSRLLNLRGLARGLVYWRCGSTLEANLTLLEQARCCFPDRYARTLRLRFPHFVRLLMGNRFPRLTVSREPGECGTAFGPFLYRSQAEDFASRCLDFFLVRRCDEELAPHPAHPGCIYGEMMLCLRPCQEAVSDERYQEEAREVLAFLRTAGESLRGELEEQRHAASESLDFETAARIHKRLGKLDECWRGMGDFVGLLSELEGVAVTRGGGSEEVVFWPVVGGKLRAPLRGLAGGPQCREVVGRLSRVFAEGSSGFDETDHEHLAVLTRWKHSTWCDGEWVRIHEKGKIPSRKMLNAAKRLGIAHRAGAAEGTGGCEQLSASQHTDEATQLPDHD